MKNHFICLLFVTALLSVVLASCSVGGNTSTSVKQTQHSVMSYSEKASFYDELVAGENDPIPLTTELNSMVAIEGDTNLLEGDLYQKVVDLANQVFPRMRSKYSDSSYWSITIMLDSSSAGYSPCYGTGNTIVLNTDWLNKHPKESDVLIEAFASTLFSYSKKDTIPDWLIDSMKLYVRDEYGLNREGSSFRLPQRYNGKSYNSDSYSGAAFLKWIKTSQNVDIVDRLNRQMLSVEGYDETVWSAATGKTLYQLWTEYQNA